MSGRGSLLGRRVNFVTAHDGFTLQDLVAYNDKHNEANLEDHRDGTNDIHSWNCGVEGPTDDPEILELRGRQKRNFLATLLLSRGVPMICGGDEVGRTQNGNNNAYAQDNETSWFDWTLDTSRGSLLQFASSMIELRKSHPNLHRRKFFQDRHIDPEAPDRLVNGDLEGDILWIRPDGKEMSHEEWHAGWVRCVGMLLNGRTLDDVNAVGEPIYDDTFLILCNPHHETIRFSLPLLRAGKIWELCVDTRQPVVAKRRKSRKLYYVMQRSLVLLVESSQSPQAAPSLTGV